MANEVTVAAVQLLATPAHTPAQNRAHALDMLAQAARRRPDLVLLPEAVAMLSYPDGRPDFTYRDVAELVPGPTTERAAAIARRNATNVLIGLIADRGPDVPCQNVVVVIDREGKIAGSYEKLHEPEVCRLSQAAGTGAEVPVFALDFGTIGVLACYDLHFPEVAAILALKGAQVLCLPHLIDLPAPLEVALQMRARAVDNALPLVAAGKAPQHKPFRGQDGLFPTCILDARGRLVAQSTRNRAEVVTATLELAPVRVDHLGRLENDINWNQQRRREMRLDVYAREYRRLAEVAGQEGGAQ